MIVERIPNSKPIAEHPFGLGKVRVFPQYMFDGKKPRAPKKPMICSQTSITFVFFFGFSFSMPSYKLWKNFGCIVTFKSNRSWKESANWKLLTENVFFRSNLLRLFNILKIVALRGGALFSALRKVRELRWATQCVALCSVMLQLFDLYGFAI